MKKKISLLLCVLAAMLSFTACGSKQATETEYDEATIEQAADFMIEYCSSADEATIQQWNEMSDFELEYQLMQAGLPYTPESFLGALDSWQAAIVDCGQFVSHGDYVFEETNEGLEVTAEAQFSERDASILFVFDEHSYLSSVTVDAKYSTGEILEKAGLNTLLGMGTVFAVLIFISLLISLFKFIPALERALTKKPEKEESEAQAQTVAAPTAAPAVTGQSNDMELIAVISAAIAAAEGTSTDAFIVRSIRRRPSNKWNS